MPFTPFKKGGKKSVPGAKSKKGGKPNPFAEDKAPPFGSTKKTKKGSY